MEGREGTVGRVASASVEALVRATLVGHALEAAVTTVPQYYRKVLNRRLPPTHFELAWNIRRVRIIAISVREYHGARGLVMHLSLKWSG